MSAFSKHCDAFKQEQAGCPGFSVMFKHILSSSHGENDGALAVHSQLAGTAVLLQKSELSRHSVVFKQEHGGCPGYAVSFKHTLGNSHGSKVGALLLHSQVGGNMVLLQVSALIGHDESSIQEQGGCPGLSVLLIHIMGNSHAANVGALKLHSQVAGVVVLLQVSALFKQWSDVRQEHGGWSGASVIFRHVLPASHGAYDALLFALHSQVGGVVELLHVSAFSKQCEEFRQEHGGCPGFSVIFTQSLPISHGSNDG